MPILAAEPDLYPEDLFQNAGGRSAPDKAWWALYCLARLEKKLMRRLRDLEVAHYCPLIAKRSRSPRGRVRTSYLPLFPGYVFVYGADPDRYQAVSTGCISRCLEVLDGDALCHDLSQIHHLTQSGASLTAESRLASGHRVRISSGPFAGVEGVIIRRQNKTRILVAVRYLQQGASMLLDDWQVEPIA